MLNFENLIRNEYFPAELPPCFNTDTFADNFKKIELYVKNRNLQSSEPVTFSGYKNINSRRLFSIPNPFHYAQSAIVISENSDQLFKIFQKSKASLTCPIKKKPGRDEAFIKRSNSIADSKEKVKAMYKSNTFEIRLDIQSFFDSIYTHSIPWSIHTKKFSKINKKDMNLLGNKLDFCMQNMNSSQTNGVLVGNAVSRIISEIILCTIDQEIKKKIPQIDYVRYVDDYYIFTSDSANIKNIISIIRLELAKYELILNENKIQVFEGPFVFGKKWIEQMRIYSALEPSILLEKSIIEYQKYKDISILRYSLNVIRNIEFSNKEWKRIEPIIINIWVSFPSLSNVIILILKNNEKFINIQLIKSATYAIIDSQLNIGGDEEIIWAVWIFKTLNLKMSLACMKRLLSTENWLAIIILLDIISSRKKEPQISKLIDGLRDKIINDYFYDAGSPLNMYKSIWLLAYEADINKWLNTGNNKVFNLASKEEFFKLLKENYVEFYNKNYKYNSIPASTGSNLYVTKLELFEILKETKDFLDSNRKIENKDSFNKESFKKILEKVSSVIIKGEVY